MSVLSPDVFSSKQTCSKNRYYMYIINYAMVFNKFYFQKISKFSCAEVRLAGKASSKEASPHRSGTQYYSHDDLSLTWEKKKQAMLSDNQMSAVSVSLNFPYSIAACGNERIIMTYEQYCQILSIL